MRSVRHVRRVLTAPDGSRQEVLVPVYGAPTLDDFAPEPDIVRDAKKRHDPRVYRPHRRAPKRRNAASPKPRKPTPEPKPARSQAEPAPTPRPPDPRVVPRGERVNLEEVRERCRLRSKPEARELLKEEGVSPISPGGSVYRREEVEPIIAEHA